MDGLSGTSSVETERNPKCFFIFIFWNGKNASLVCYMCVYAKHYNGIISLKLKKNGIKDKTISCKTRRVKICRQAQQISDIKFLNIPLDEN